MQHLLSASKIALIFLLLTNLALAKENKVASSFTQELGKLMASEQQIQASKFGFSNYDLDSSEFLEKYPNIYFQVYNHFLENVQQQQKKQVGDKLNLKDAALDQALSGQNLSEKSLQATDTVTSNKNLQPRISLIKANASSIAENKIKSFYKESFYNDSTFDSDIDIVSKLNDIYSLLFMERADSTFELGFDDKDQAAAAADADQAQLQAGPGADEEAAEGEDAVEEQGGPGEGRQAGSQADKSQPETVCPIDPELEEQIRAFELEQESQALEGQEGGGQEAGGAGGPGPNGSGGEGPVQAGSVAEPLPELDNNYCPEGQRFCLRIENQYERFGLIQPPSSCINCLLTQIKQLFIELNGQNLLPRKVTGNLFEMPLCKSASLQVGLGLNFVMIGKPIIPASHPLKTIAELQASKIEKDIQTRTHTPQPQIQQTQNTSTIDAALKEVNEIKRFQNNIQQVFAQSGELKNTKETYQTFYKDLLGRQKTFAAQFEAIFHQLDSSLHQFKLITQKKKCYE